MSKNNESKDNEAIGFVGLNNRLTDPDEEYQAALDSVRDTKETSTREKNQLTSSVPNTENSVARDENGKSSHLGESQISIEQPKKNVKLIFGLLIGLALVCLVVYNYSQPISPVRHTESNRGKKSNTKSAPLHSLSTQKGPSESRETPKPFHVIANSLNMRSGPGTDFSVIGRLTKWEEVLLFDSQSGWARIKCDNNIGWVSMKYLNKGTGELGYRLYCKRNAGTSPYSGEILLRKGHRGHGRLSVSNQTDRAALIRLKQVNGPCRLMMYMGPYNAENLNQIGEGNYQVQVMYGDNYSRLCKEFTDNKSVEVFDQMMIMEEKSYYGRIQYSAYSLSLHKVVHGNATTRKVDPSVFKD